MWHTSTKIKWVQFQNIWIIYSLKRDSQSVQARMQCFKSSLYANSYYTWYWLTIGDKVCEGDYYRAGRCPLVGISWKILSNSCVISAKSWAWQNALFTLFLTFTSKERFGDFADNGSVGQIQRQVVELKACRYPHNYLERF